MKTITGIRVFFSLPLLALLLTGCTRELPGGEGQGESISFVATMDDGIDTRAVLRAAGPLSDDVSLGLVAFKYAADGAAPSDWVLHTPSVVQLSYDSRTSGISSGKWIPSATQRLKWPGEGYVRFFAYAPYGAAGVTVNAADNAAPSISYTVPEPSAQEDLLVSTAASTRQYEGDPGWMRIDVPLTMMHTLTGLRFRVPEGMDITSVSISGVYDSGTLNLSAPAAWSGLSGSATYELTNLSLGSGLRADSANPGFRIMSDDMILFLMPQVLPADARVEVQVAYYGMPRTIQASISGTRWEPGKLLTYTVTLDPLPNITEGYTVNRPDIWK